QAPPEVEAGLVEADPLGGEVVGADDGGVAAGAATADVALLEDGDAGEAMVGAEGVGRRQPVPPAADDDHVVLVAEPAGRAEHARLGVGLAQAELQQSKGQELLPGARVASAPRGQRSRSSAGG